jgi:hypothetical protein
MKISLIFLFSILAYYQNSNLNQDIIYPKASEIKLSNGESCEVISEKDMTRARKILQTYWTGNISDSTWADFNRQYVTYHSNNMGTVVYINGSCLAKPAEFYEQTWVLGMAANDCYFTCFVNLKKKKVVSFQFNTYSKK